MKGRVVDRGLRVARDVPIVVDDREAGLLAPERDDELPQIVALLLLVPAGRQRRARIGGRENSEEIRRVVEHRIHREVERLREVPHRRHGAVRVRRHRHVLGLRQRGERVVGAAQVAQHAQLGALGDGIAERLDDPEVAMPFGGDDLETGHDRCIHSPVSRRARGLWWDRSLGQRARHGHEQFSVVYTARCGVPKKRLRGETLSDAQPHDPNSRFRGKLTRWFNCVSSRLYL